MQQNIQRRRRRFGLGLFIGVVLVLGLEAVTRKNPDSTAAMPPAEIAFITEVADARTAWLAAPNDLAKSTMRAARAARLCRALPELTAADWAGSIARIDPDNFPDFHGKKSVRIVIALVSHISVASPAAPLFNNPSEMVEIGSPIYATAARLPIGGRVKFSARFFGSGQDCMQETSFTDNGAMADPEFKIQLIALAPRG